MRRARPIFLIAGGAILAAVLLVALGGPVLLAPRLRPRAEAALSTALDRPVTVRAVTIGAAFRRLDLLDVTIAPAPGGVGASVIILPRVQLALRPWRLLFGQLAVRRVTVIAATVGLERPPEVPLLDFLAGVIPPVDATLAGAFGDLPKIQVLAGRLDFRDLARGTRLSLDGIGASLAVEAPERLRLTLRVQAGRWEHAGTASPIGPSEFQGTFDGPDLGVEAAQLSVGRSHLRASGRIATLAAAPQAFLDVQLTGVLEDLRPFVPTLPQVGSLSVKGQLTGPLARPELLSRGTLTLDPAGTESASLRLDYQDGTWRLHEIRGQAFGGFLEGTLVAGADGRAEVRLRGEGLAVERVLAGLGRTETLRGRLAADLDLTLVPSDLGTARGRVRLRGEALRWAADPPPGQPGANPPGSLTADLQFAGTDWIGADVRLLVAGTNVEARGRIAGPGGRSDLRLRARVPDAARLGPLLGFRALQGAASIDGRLGGQLGAPVFRGRLHWERLRLGPVPVDLVEGDVEVGATAVRSPNLLIRWARTTAQLAGAAHLPAGLSVYTANLARDLSLDLRATVPGGRLEDLASAAGLALPVSGAVQIPELVLAGPVGALAGRARVSLSDVTILNEAWPAAELRLTVKPGGLGLEALSLRRGQDRLDVTGEVGFGGALRLDLTTSPLALDSLGLLRGVPIAGTAAFALRARGSVRAPELQGTARFAALTFAGFALGDGQARLGYGSGRLDLALPILAGAGQATGVVGPGPVWPFRFDLALRDAPLTPVLERTEMSALAGAAASGSGRLVVTGEARGPAPTRVDVQLGTAEVRAFGEAWRSVEPVRLQWTRAGYAIQALRLGSNQGEVAVAGRGGPPGLDLRVEGRLPLVAVATFVPGLRPIAGAADVLLSVRGAPDAPAVTGHADVRDGRLGLGTLPDDFTDVIARVELREAVITLPRVEARLADGRFRAKGELRRRAAGWEVALDFSEEGGRAERLIPHTESRPDRLSGVATIRGLITAQSRDPWGTLAGTASVVFRSGRIGRNSVLARVFSLLNIAKVLDIRLPELPGEGMPYRRIAADLRITGGVATTDNGVLESDAMHATAVGTLDLDSERLDLKLAVHPLQTVDRIVGKIPLLGWILTGNQQGLVVAYYDVKGTFDAPTVTPLPIQSVGRGVLGIFQRILGLPAHLLGPEPSPHAAGTPPPYSSTHRPE